MPRTPSSNHVQKQLDKQLASERNKVVYVVAAIVGVLLLIGVISIPISFTSFTGKTVSFSPSASEFGLPPTATIQLENGEKIEVVWPRNQGFETDTEVTIMQSSTLIGWKTYRAKETSE